MLFRSMFLYCEHERDLLALAVRHRLVDHRVPVGRPVVRAPRPRDRADRRVQRGQPRCGHVLRVTRVPQQPQPPPARRELDRGASVQLRERCAAPRAVTLAQPRAAGRRPPTTTKHTQTQHTKTQHTKTQAKRRRGSPVCARACVLSRAVAQLQPPAHVLHARIRGVDEVPCARPRSAFPTAAAAPPRSHRNARMTQAVPEAGRSARARARAQRTAGHHHAPPALDRVHEGPLL